jgi:hypothetical protein
VVAVTAGRYRRLASGGVTATVACLVVVSMLAPAVAAGVAAGADAGVGVGPAGDTTSTAAASVPGATATGAAVGVRESAASTRDGNGTDAVDGTDGRVRHPDGLVFVDVETNESDPVPDRNFTVTATVENSPESGEWFVVREVAVFEVAAPGPDDDPLNRADVDHRVRPGDTETARVSVALDESGERTLGVRIRLQSSNGAWTNSVRPVTVDVGHPHPGLAVRTDETLPGSPGNVTVSVSNGLDVPVRNVDLRLRADEVSLDDPRRVAPSIAAGDERTFTFVASGPTEGPETFEAQLSYVPGNGSSRELTRTLDARFRAPTSPGAINLTGLEVVREGDRLTIRGTASNVGNTDVSSVLVEVGDRGPVRPGRSNADYFVGRVPASDYASFEVRARLTDNVSAVTVPLEVSYLVDGVRRERTVRVAYEAPDTDTESTPSGGGFPLSGAPLAVAGGVGVLAVGGVGWRWFGGDE